MDGDKNTYRDPLIAVSFFACLFFIILVVILVVWCKNRRKVEVKTVTIQPKKRPPTLKTTSQNGNGTPANGQPKKDVETIEAAPVSTDGIDLESGSSKESSPIDTRQEPAVDDKLETKNETETEEQPQPTPTPADDNTEPKLESDPAEIAIEQETTTSKEDLPTLDQGHSNPSFEPEETKET